MEFIPHLWISQISKSNVYIQSKKIKSIIFLSKKINFLKDIDIEQIRVPLEVSDNNKNDNIIIYQHLYDVTYFIFDKIVNNKNILIIGNEDDSSILSIFLLAYFIRYGKLDIKHSLEFLNSKINMYCFNYNDALFKFYNEIKKH